jgi:hypothetical protein
MKYQPPWQNSPESRGRRFVLIRRFGSEPVEKTHAYEALTMDSLYVVRGSNIIQETKDKFLYRIEGIVPGQYTITAIEHPWWRGCSITRQQSKTLFLKDAEEAVLDFDLRNIPKDSNPNAVETKRPVSKLEQAIESDKLVLKLVDPNSQPVVGASVRNYVSWSDIAYHPPIWLNHTSVNFKSDEHGKVILDAEELFGSGRNPDGKRPLTAVDVEQDLAGLQMLTREDLGKEVTLKLQPRCRVRGRVSAATARNRRWSTNVLTVEVDWGGHLPCVYRYLRAERFEIVLPPGQYKVKVYAEDPNKAVTIPIRIKSGQRDLDLTPYLEVQRKKRSIISDSQEGSIKCRFI